jgi:CO dehydrogenase maturation factor
MAFTFAISGKGGVGKTTIAGILVTRLIKKGLKPILAVDADPNMCLDMQLGVKVIKSIGGIREEAREIASKGDLVGIAKQDYLQLKVSECLVEADDFDLVSMGRSEGPGCYCYANNALKTIISEVSSGYPFLVLDNEAGLENLSRRIVQQVDVLIMVADPSRMGIETLLRLQSLSTEMNIRYDKLVVIINRNRNREFSGEINTIKEKTSADLVMNFVDNIEIAGFAEKGKSLFDLPDNNEIVKQIDTMIDQMVNAPG